MSWKDTIKRPTDFQFFLHEVFNVPPIESKGLKPSKVLVQSVRNGTIVDKITEEDFEIMSAYVERMLRLGWGLEHFVWILEKISEGYPNYLNR